MNHGEMADAGAGTEKHMRLVRTILQWQKINKCGGKNPQNKTNKKSSKSKTKE